MATAPVLQWKRECLVTIGDHATGKDALVVKDLRIAFEITKTIGSAPNTAKIEIFNLHPDNEGKIKGEFDEVTLDAGYKGHALLVFAGNITSVKRPREENDWITTIIAADGDMDTKDTVVNASFIAGTSTQQILEHIVAGMSKVKLGYTKVTDRQRIRGRVLTGMARHKFDEIAAHSDAHWSVQDGELVIVPVASTLPNEAIVINASTGMLGTPELTDKGIDVRCLLNPQLKVNGTIKLDNNDLREKLLKQRQSKPGAKKHKSKKKVAAHLDPDGLYKVIQLTHVGDTRSDLWESRVRCKALGGK